MMAAGKLDQARALLERAAEPARDGEVADAQPHEGSTRALALFNLGSLEVECGNLDKALHNYATCVRLTGGLSDDENEAACLWVPILENGVLVLEEVREVNIAETSQRAWDVVRGVANLGTVDEA